MRGEGNKQMEPWGRDNVNDEGSNEETQQHPNHHCEYVSAHRVDPYSHYPSTKNHCCEQPGQVKQQSNNKAMGDEGGDRYGG